MPEFRRLGKRLTSQLADTADSLARLNPNAALDVTTRVPRPHRFRSAQEVHVHRDPDKPYERHVMPDFEEHPEIRLENRPYVLDVIRNLPRPWILSDETCEPEWNSVALFFNLDMPLESNGQVIAKIIRMMPRLLCVVASIF